MLFIDDDESYILCGTKDGRSGSNNHFGFACFRRSQARVLSPRLRLWCQIAIFSWNLERNRSMVWDVNAISGTSMIELFPCSSAAAIACR